MSDRLDAMHAFVAVCDRCGFASAARQLGMSASVVTRLVAGLETRLGARLLHRTTRAVRLTDAGTRFLERARRILAEVEEAELSAQDGQAQPRGRLVIAAPLLFGRMHVAPVVSRFLAAYPGVSAEMRLSDQFCSLVEDEVDVAIRIGNLPSSGLVARRLGQTRRMLVASPAYLAAQNAPLQAPSDLAAHRVIAFQAMTPGREWAFREPGGGTLFVGVEPRFATNNGETAIAHAIDGGGITAAFCYQVEAALRSGVLVAVLEGFAWPPVPIHAVFPTGRLLPGRVRRFLDMLEQAATQWDFPAHA